MIMNKKERAIDYTSNQLHLIQCPICQSSFSIEHHQSIVCANGHTFDFAKQGYINFLTHPSKSNYDKSLFKARHHIINESGLYSSVHENILLGIKKYTNEDHPLSIADLGCGEGSHLRHITAGLEGITTNVGIDIAKEGIIAATKNEMDALWFVADLAKIPIQKNSIDVLLNILSPANYEEFRRIAKKDALCIKLVPRKNYLRELRDFIQKPLEETNAPKALFKNQVDFQETISVQYTKHLHSEELFALCQMTPLMWGVAQDKINQFILHSPGEVTMDIDILIGKVK